MYSTLLLFGLLLNPSVFALPSTFSQADLDKRGGRPLSDLLPIKHDVGLPVAVGSILAGYFGFTLLVVIAILTVGRRLRRAAQTSRRTLAMEMIEPNQTNFNPAYDAGVSPAPSNPYGVTPTSTIDTKRDWPSPTAPGRSYTWGSLSKGHKKQPSVQSSVATFDESVIEEDKNKNLIEMERLYAAVMEHDEENSKSGVQVAAQPLSQHPPELQHLRYAPANHQSTSPMDTNFPLRTNTASPRQSGSKLSRPSPISISGTTSLSRASSTNSFGSFGKNRGVRNLAISPPMGSPDLDPDVMRKYGETEPLTPRHYTPGPPPSPPNQRISNASDRYNRSPISSPLRKNFPSSIRTSRTFVSNPQSPLLPTPHSATNLTFKFPPSTTEHNESTTPNYPHWTPQPQAQSPPKPQRKRAPLAIRTNSETSTLTASSLPLRTAPLPLRNLNNNSSAIGNRPPSMIKATVLERRVPEINHLRTPMTGVPATPYSPYMPHTPMTPITPRMLVGKEERRRRDREEGRRVLTARDVVEEEGSMWGDAY